MIIRLTELDEFTARFDLNEWQSGVCRMLWQDHTNSVRTIDMGRRAGHTYLACAMAFREFPLRTKIYATNKNHLREFSSAVFRPQLTHESIDCLTPQGFAGYSGQAVDVVVIDMAGQLVKMFRDSIKSLVTSLPNSTVLLLQGKLI